MLLDMDTLVDKFNRYESDQMSESEEISFFQELVNTGMVWNLQGHYGRVAVHLIENGLVTVPEAGEQ